MKQSSGRQLWPAIRRNYHLKLVLQRSAVELACKCPALCIMGSCLSGLRLRPAFPPCRQLGRMHQVVRPVYVELLKLVHVELLGLVHVEL